VLKLTKTPIIPGQLASQSFHRAEHVTPKTSIPFCFAFLCLFSTEFSATNQRIPKQNQIKSNIRTKTRKSQNQMSEPKNQQHFKTHNFTIDPSTPKSKLPLI